MTMAYSKALDVVAVFNAVESEFPDKSTEFLLEVAAERCRLQRVQYRCDCCDVAEALIQTGKFK